MKILYLFIFIAVVSSKLSASDLKQQLQKFYEQKQLMGFALEISENSKTIFKANYGMKDLARNLTLDDKSMFRMASLSKSMTSAGLMLLVDQGKLKLTDSLEKIFGFKAINSNFPNIPITVQMILSHQSSLIECDAYNGFLTDTCYYSKSGTQIPNISTMFIKGQKHYGQCTFSKTHAPGTFFTYANFNFLLAGTIIEKLSGQRFDLFMRERIFSKFSQNMNFNPSKLSNTNDLAVLYEGENGNWVVAKDNYNGTIIPQFNWTGYVIGTNAGYYGPQGSVRASVNDLTKFSDILRNKGIFNGTTVIPSAMVSEMIRPRYKYHGNIHGGLNDFQNYGTGLLTTSYRENFQIWPHKKVVGHIGDAYGLASAYWFHGNYSVAYAISGILNGYSYNSSISYFSMQRCAIANLTYQYLFD